MESFERHASGTTYEPTMVSIPDPPSKSSGILVFALDDGYSLILKMSQWTDRFPWAADSPRSLLANILALGWIAVRRRR